MRAHHDVLTIIEQWTKPSHVRLRGGEFSAQEMRAVLAVVDAIHREVSCLSSETASRWIPVEERQPEKYGLHYLVVHRGGKVTDGEWIHSPVTGKGAWSWASVTHWMPMPDGPRG